MKDNRRNFWMLCLITLLLCSFTYPRQSSAQDPPAKISSDTLINSPRVELELVMPVSDDYFFGRISDIAKLPDGKIVVLDSGKQQILKFAESGKFLKTIANKGRGPGEIEGAYLNQLASSKSGKLVVFDQTNAKIIFWDEAGNYIRDHKMLIGWGASVEWNNKGNIIFRKHPFQPDKNENRIIEFSEIDPSNGNIEVAGTIPLKEEYDAENTCVFCNWTLTNKKTIITARHDTSYNFYELSTEGEVIQSWDRKGISPIRYSEEELEEIKYNRENSPIGYPEDHPLPKFKERFRAFELDSKQRIWIQLSASEGESVFDVFNRKGRFLQRLVIEKEIRMLEIQHDYLLSRLDKDNHSPQAFIYKILD